MTKKQIFGTMSIGILLVLAGAVLYDSGHLPALSMALMAIGGFAAFVMFMCHI